MPQTEFASAALFEHRFWLQILGDHSRFIFMSLTPDNVAEIQQADHFKRIFDQLLEQARQDLNEQQLQLLTNQATYYATSLRNFKLELLQKQLLGQIKTHLPPTFYNHMLNEIEEYLRILNYLSAGQVPPNCHPLHLHLLWLPDASGHAGSIAANLDLVEKRLMERSQEFSKHFDDYHLKAIELAGYLRTNLTQFPALAQFTSDVELEIRLFTEFLEEIERLELDERILGTLSPLMPDHMAREECYYLIKLAQSTAGSLPDCDPTKPRVE
ncbi:DUF2935 domain-containing protein [Brevibacillus ginsengisoli]|uniref:DUF2935 domain-containing protein n=1 Tax=Brevibacillus ginsengisoli TaxID=363854 RepID=UPI003CFB4E1C